MVMCLMLYIKYSKIIREDMTDMLQINYVWFIVRGRHWYLAKNLKLII